MDLGGLFQYSILKSVFLHFLLVLVIFLGKNIPVSCLVDDSLAEKQVRKDIWKVRIYELIHFPPVRSLAPMCLASLSLRPSILPSIQTKTQIEICQMGGQSAGTREREKEVRNAVAFQVAFSSYLRSTFCPNPRHT